MNRSHTGPGRNHLRRDKRMQPHTNDSYRDPKRPTGVHMVRRLGEAPLHAHHGDLAIDYPDGEDVLRAHWTRDDA
ncbi:hypothetical protein WT27_01840 [Burkholderia territorii]|uniref:Uncharacterized protein n=1 Tax=Burkholderia territorii TaxID=1503055 RepID=A0A106E0J1_9BURK|nr:hypothetical protein [Burkholderia territorii]KVV38126.1 hypothetical protein WT27_01840 [Burkholderia territorii]KVX38778.1 hypothetical protein WT31_00245 [Burkholderia territorii]